MLGAAPAPLPSPQGQCSPARAPGEPRLAPVPPMAPRAAQPQQQLTVGAAAAEFGCCAQPASQELTQRWAHLRALCPSCGPSVLPISAFTPLSSLPQAELPAPYGPWMEIARDLPQLITSRRLRARVHRVPVLSLLALERSRALVRQPCPRQGQTLTALYFLSKIPRFAGHTHEPATANQ